MNEKKFRRMYENILQGNARNINFEDLCDFVVDLGFRMARQKGTSHRIYTMDEIPDIINLQEGKDGKAKPYQIDQIKKIIRKYKLGGKE